MKSEENKTLVWIIVLLVVFNLTTLATIGYHIYDANRGGAGSRGGAAPAKGEGVQFNGRFFRDSLNLSREQVDRFREVNHRFRSDANEVNVKLRGLRQRMMQNMAGPKPDTLLLNQLSDSIGVLHARLKRDTYQYYLGIRGICTKDQQVKLKAIFETVFGSEDSAGCSGKGAGQGHHRGQCRNQ